MQTEAISQLLLLYTWFLLSGLILFFMLIARSYQRFSGEITHYRQFWAPIILFGAAAVRYTTLDLVAHDPLGDVLSALAGVLLALLVARLHRQMTAGRRRA